MANTNAKMPRFCRNVMILSGLFEFHQIPTNSFSFDQRCQRKCAISREFYQIFSSRFSYTQFKNVNISVLKCTYKLMLLINYIPWLITARKGDLKSSNSSRLTLSTKQSIWQYYNVYFLASFSLKRFYVNVCVKKLFSNCSH